MLAVRAHAGVSDSKGYSYEFAGPFLIRVSQDGAMLFGKPTRYLELQDASAEQWDMHLNMCADKYKVRTHAGLHKGAPLTPDTHLAGRPCPMQHMMYNIFTNNCHAFVACFLNSLGYQGRRDW